MPCIGYHNFYESKKYEDTKCLGFRPAFLLYDAVGDEGNLRGKNNRIKGNKHKNIKYNQQHITNVIRFLFAQGFGLAALGKAYSANNRYEYPDRKAINVRSHTALLILNFEIQNSFILNYHFVILHSLCLVNFQFIVGEKEVADCLLKKADEVGLTTMHVFFADTSLTNPNCM